MTDAVVVGPLTLASVDHLAITEERHLAAQAIPGWDGDLVQDLGSRAVQIHVRGVTIGESSSQQLEELRGILNDGEPLDFASSAASASQVEQVLVRQLQVRQHAQYDHILQYDMHLC